MIGRDNRCECDVSKGYRCDMHDGDPANDDDHPTTVDPLITAIRNAILNDVAEWVKDMRKQEDNPTKLQKRWRLTMNITDWVHVTVANAQKQRIAELEAERDRLKASRDNPFCSECKETDCEVSMDGMCNLLRVYRKAKTTLQNIGD